MKLIFLSDCNKGLNNLRSKTANHNLLTNFSSTNR